MTNGYVESFCWASFPLWWRCYNDDALLMMLYYGDERMFTKFWDDALLIICGGVILLALDKIIVTLEEIRNYLKKFSKTIGDE
jgi:hypothetical protein